MGKPIFRKLDAKLPWHCSGKVPRRSAAEPPIQDAPT